MNTPPTQPAVIIREPGRSIGVPGIAIGITLGLLLFCGVIAGGWFGLATYQESRRVSQEAAAAKAEADYFAKNAKVYRMTLESYYPTGWYTMDILALNETDAMQRATTSGAPTELFNYADIRLAPPGTAPNLNTWRSTKRTGK